MLPGSAGAIEIEILKPPPGTPVFGDVEVLVEVRSGESISKVEIYLDGHKTGQLAAAPFLFWVDVGEENREHIFKAIVYGAGGLPVATTRSTPPIRIDEVVDLEMQQVYVTVLGPNDHRILGLGQESFQLRDAGKKQTIVTLAIGDIPFTAVLLLDGSESMRGEPFKALLEGAESFIAGMAEYDEASVMAFSDRVLARSPFLSKAAPLSRSLRQLEVGGGTRLHDHLYLALRLVENRLGRRVVIVVSDRFDVHSVLRSEQLRKVVRRSQAQIYWVRLDALSWPLTVSGSPISPHRKIDFIDSWQSPKRDRKGVRRLEALVQESGGRIVNPKGAEGVPGALQDILQGLREQYAIGYYPTPRHDDGRWREVEVRIRDGRYRARTQQGYLDF